MDETERKIAIFCSDVLLREKIAEGLRACKAAESIVLSGKMDDLAAADTVLIVRAPDDAADLPEGFQAAPADIFSWPFRMGALLERVQKYLTDDSARVPEEEIAIGTYKLRSRENLLRGKDGEIVLTEKERDLLLALYRQNGEKLDRQALLEKIWGYADGIETHTLETHIYRLRQKIEKDPANPQLLLTDGNGYKLS